MWVMKEQFLFDNLFDYYKIKNHIRLIELFGGIGSQAMALRDIGADFTRWRLVELCKYAVASYNAIHGTNFKPTDIKNIKGEDLDIVDTQNFTYILTYSFPCQDLSLAGKQNGMKKGSGTRSGLLWEVERLLNETEILPQILLMENVPQVHGTKNIDDFNNWINFLKSKGYSNFWQDLNAKDYGVAQNRVRCFMVSILSDGFYEFPKTVKLEKCIKNYLENEVYNTLTSSQKDNLLLKTKPKCINLYDEKGKETSFQNRIYKTDSISPAITTAFRPNYIIKNKEEVCKVENNYKIRKLTPRECWRLMGFSDEDFEKAAKVNSNTQLYKQAGNSIVKDVLMAIFEKIIEQRKE